ncbi:DNA-binding transcriptional activator PunR [Ferrimonas lipolytica]|uniref:LysR family transcriptional regulator n=1 Tax=Ferrimonas lipolytica TaxID=2724191 RepID=A0A6H1UID9_9GAMM|nr:DNA-binding transcriptional activator PunR [Ferrimonas lipolytica]QIZ78804.1 LysR family transcriptional regulator [Ferrimonas lipolytica]
MLDNVARLGSFSAAAHAMHKVPSAISYSVRQVEQQLGVLLFERKPRQVVLTPAGEHFISQCRLWLREMEQVKLHTQRVANGWQHQINLALDTVVKAERVTELIRDFYNRFNDAELVINNEVFNGVWDALADGRADIAIGATAAIPVGGDFGYRDMGLLRWALVMAPDHPCADIVPLPVEELERFPMVSLEDTSRTLPRRSNWKLDNQRRILVPDWNNAVACVTAGIGVAYVPRHFVEPSLLEGTLVERELPTGQRPSPCCLTWRKESEGPLMQWLLDYLGDEQKLQREWLL